MNFEKGLGLHSPNRIDEISELPVLRGNFQPNQKFSKSVEKVTSYVNKANQRYIEKESVLTWKRMHSVRFTLNADLGPGYYQTFSSTAKTPAARVLSKLKPPALRNTSKSPIIEANSNSETLAKYRPENRSMRLKKLATDLESRIQKIKANKQSILEEKRSQTLESILRKSKKYEFHLRKKEISNIAGCWIRVVTCAGLCSVGIARLKAKIVLRKRAGKVLKVLFVLCLSIGKFKRLAKVVRRRTYQKVINSLIPYAGKILYKRKKINAKKVIYLIENALTNTHLITLMHTWRSRIIFIQRWFRSCMIQKRISISLKFVIWNFTEHKMHQEKVAKQKGTKVPKIVLSEVDLVKGAFSIPKRVKLFYIKELLFKKYRENRRALQRIKIQKLRKVKNSKKFTYQSTEKSVNEEPKTSVLAIYEHEYRRLIATALSSRLQWESISESSFMF